MATKRTNRKEKQPERTPVKELNFRAIEVKPVNYDWDSEGLGETWEYWEASRCQGCNEVIVHSGGGEKHSDIDPDSECSGSLGYGSGPMMSYHYPVSSWFPDPEDAAKRLIDSPLCVVRVGDSYGLALTGGGMDLTWEICEAFMLLGMLPPVHFCDLPEMADRPRGENDRWIIDGCIASVSVMAQWQLARDKRLKKLRRLANVKVAKNGARP